MKTLPPAILLGIDTPIGLSVVRELGGHGVPVHGIGRSAAAIGAHSRFVADSSVRVPGPLADWLPALIRRTGAKALFAISEGDLIELAAMPEEIEGCRILTPRTPQLAIVLDKRETLRRARALGLSVPESWQPRTGEDFTREAAARPYPVVVKWPDPMAVAALLEQRGLELVKAEFARDADALLAILARYASLGVWPIVQGYCPGRGLGQMIHMEAGRATLCFQHVRLHEWPPEGGVSTLCAAEPIERHQAQMALSEALLAGIGWEGPAMVEYRHDPVTGRYWLMEINGRFWGSLPLARACGAHFAWESYRRRILGEHHEAGPYRASLRARYMIPETRRLIRLLFQRGRIADPFFEPRPIGDLFAWLSGFLDPRMRYYVFSAADPGPFLADMRAAFRKLLPRGKRVSGAGPHPRSA
ncbi:carboxylate--amine ligase [Flavisphingomonas formosensis]|uniref:carboxylate--amine ligase n=1 Tax=Flavisphingomonas formosensis TaxID=861534 RepID=UPI0012FB8863|nr:carboxylate--amine ligase [Sphingomonas formosensis]